MVGRGLRDDLESFLYRYDLVFSPQGVYSPALYSSAIHRAAANNNVATIRKALFYGVGVDHQITRTGSSYPEVATPLHYAARAGADDAVRELLAYGASPDAHSLHMCECVYNQPLEFIGDTERIYHPEVGEWTAAHLALCHGRLSASECLPSLLPRTYPRQSLDKYYGHQKERNDANGIKRHHPKDCRE